MEFPKILDFSEVDTMPSALLELYDRQVHDVRQHAPVAAHHPINARGVLFEMYPRILRMIDATWGSQELQNKFTKWLLTDQEGRCGWPSAARDALMQLSNFHAEKFGLEGEVNWKQMPDRW